MYNLYFDGGSRGNPGPAGCGWLIENETTKYQGSRYLGKNTNNFAEYSGLYDALQKAKELGLDDLKVYGDSKLVIEQMKGKWKVKAPNLIEIAGQTRELAKEFKEISFEWIPRSLNAKADALANQAMNKSYN